MATRQCLYLVSWLASVAAGCSDMGADTEPPDGEEEEGEAEVPQTPYENNDGTDGGGPEGEEPDPIFSVAPEWGRLATDGYAQRPIVGTLFFAGEARDGGAQYYEYRPTSNLHFYTEQPVAPENLRWSSDPSTRSVVLQQMVDTGVNVVFLSNWGPFGSNAWSRWAPMQSSTDSHDEFVAAIVNHPTPLNLLVVPFIESNPEWAFRSDFVVRSGGLVRAPVLVDRIVHMVRRTLQRTDETNSFEDSDTTDDPTAADWNQRWAQIYDAKGVPRFAIALIHASSDSRIDDQKYVEGLEWVASEVERLTGVRVGFLLDALPPNVRAPGRFFPAPARTAEPMKRSSSVLGISCFLPEIWSGITSDPNDVRRLAWKRTFIRDWIESEVPTLVDVSPGYDAHLVFPGSVTYGHTDAWRAAQAALVADYGEYGVVLNSWNGYTEAMSMVPTQEYGDAALLWAQALSASVTLP